MTVGRGRLFAAYGAIYVIWGSTFLATRWSVETIPPLMMACLRCLIAGAALLVFAGPRRLALLLRAEFTTHVALGALYFLCCHGLLAIALTRAPSGVAALFAATIPLWVPLLPELHRFIRSGARMWPEDFSPAD
jgi:drug/metabolite transporter (DMT)-like permease